MTSASVAGGVGAKSSVPVLRLSALSKTFGATKVLHDVEFGVDRGEIHCLLGHNGSGKSTLIKILGGIHQPDAGTRLVMGGEEQAFPLSPRQIHQLGIRFVHQSLGLIGSLTVAEHFAQDRLDGRSGWYLSPGRAVEAARASLHDFGAEVDPTAKIEDLSAVERALVAIARAVASLERREKGLAGSLLILDEPTAFLPREEVERLFEATRRIVRQRAGVILVTHDTDEVLSIADRVTVLRDGRVAGRLSRAELTREKLVRLIVGHDLEPRSTGSAQPGFARAVDVCVTRAGTVREVGFTLGRGEIVGVTGLIGSGYADLAHGLFGSRPATGRMTIGGASLDLARLTPRAAIRAGISFIPSDRAGAAAILDLSVAENAALLALRQLVNPWFFGRRRLEREVVPWLSRAAVRPLAPALEMGRLSGGNQQKVVLAKWLSNEPALLLLDEPSQGIDVGAREQIFALLRDLAARGTAILCSSTDHDQLAALCDRVLILVQGRLVAEIARRDLSASRIGEAVLSATEPPSQGSSNHA